MFTQCHATDKKKFIIIKKNLINHIKIIQVQSTLYKVLKNKNNKHGRSKTG